MTLSSDFEWHTEEDDHKWQETPPEPVENGRPTWRPWLIVLLIVLAIGLSSYYLLARRVGQTQAAITDDVIAGHELVQTAVNQADVELLNLLLSGRDGRWLAAQRELMAAGLLFDRRPLGLYRQPGPAATPEVILSPNLTEAEVIVDQPFTIQVGNGITETVILRQTAVYRLSQEQRWLLAPADHTYWGNWQTRDGRYLTLTYPARDAEVAERLARDLEAKLAEICAHDPALRCPNGRFLQVTLATDPTSLVQLNDPIVMVAGNQHLNLPTPSLVGVPQDEAAYRALFRGYAAYLLPTVNGLRCCRGALFYQALWAKQLSRHSLRPWPLGPNDYNRIHNNPIQLADLARLWSEPPQTELTVEEYWAVYALVDFLMQLTPAESPARMQQTLASAPDLFTWIQRISGNQLARPALEQAWLNFVYERADTSPTAARE
jgi:hypothetical protein